MSRYVFNQIRKIKDDNGNPIYVPPAERVPATINGVPYILSEVMPKASDDAVDTPFLIYGNPQYWIFGDRVGMEMRVYRDTIRAIDYDQIFLRFRTRAGFIEGMPAAFARLKTAAS